MYFRGDEVKEFEPTCRESLTPVAKNSLDQSAAEVLKNIESLLQKYQPTTETEPLADALREMLDASKGIQSSIDEMSQKLDLPVRPVFGKDGRLKGVMRG